MNRCAQGSSLGFRWVGIPRYEIIQADAILASFIIESMGRFTDRLRLGKAVLRATVETVRLTRTCPQRRDTVIGRWFSGSVGQWQLRLRNKYFDRPLTP